MGHRSCKLLVVESEVRGDRVEDWRQFATNAASDRASLPTARPLMQRLSDIAPSPGSAKDITSFAKMSSAPASETPLPAATPSQQEAMILSLRSQLDSMVEQQTELVGALDAKMKLMEETISSQAQTIEKLEAQQSRKISSPVRQPAWSTPPPRRRPPSSEPRRDSPRDAFSDPRRSRDLMLSRESSSNSSGRPSPAASRSNNSSSWYLADGSTTSSASKGAPLLTNRSRAVHYRKLGSASYRSNSDRFGNGVTLAMYGVTDGGNPSLSREHPGIGYYSNVHRDAKGHYWDTGRKADSRYMLPSTNVNAGPTIMPTSPILS